MNKDPVVDTIGSNGPWQRHIFIMVLLSAVPGASHNLAISFLAPNQAHHCLVNGTEGSCCRQWEYDTSFYTSTIVSEWDLVCDRRWLVSLAKSLYMIGFLFSALVFGHLADRWGRRPVIGICSFIALVSAMLCAFAPSFEFFATFRFFVAVGFSGVFNTGFVHMMEAVGSEWRALYGNFVYLGWCMGFLALPAFAWLFRDWFYIQLAITVPCLPMLAFYWLFPESPRWLISRGKTHEANKIIATAAKTNGKDPEASLYCLIAQDPQEIEKSETFVDLLRTPGLWQQTVNIYFIWFVNAFVYYGLTYNTNELSGDPFVNFALSGAVEVPAYLITAFVIRSQGRRNPLVSSMVVGGLACLLTIVLPTSPWWMSTLVSVTGKFCLTCSFAIIYVYTAEIFPTFMRNAGLGMASMCGRVGSIVAPFGRELGEATHQSVPMILFGALALASGLLVLLLPETSQDAIPDTILQAAALQKKRKQLSFCPKSKEDS